MSSSLPATPLTVSPVRRLVAGVVSLALVLTAALVGLATTAAHAAVSVTSAAFSGTTGTATVGGTLYARQGGALTLTVLTSTDTACVDVAGAFTASSSTPAATSSTAKTWRFTTTAGGGNGSQGVTATASPNVNSQGKCTGNSASATASYVLDNTGPVVAAALTPAPNGAGWNRTNVSVAWTATDAGSGVATTQPFKTDTVTAEGIAVATAPAQSDRVGNTGAAGSVTVRVDKTPPTITAAQTKNPDGTTTITFTCADGGSGIATCLANGSTTNSRTVGPDTTVTGTATDNAGNTASTTSTSPAADTTPPTLTGAPTTAPNGSNGWYTGDVTIRWTCSDEPGGSGLAGPCPADDVIGGEGENLTVTRSVSDKAGNPTTAASSPAVKIDRTAPTTTISGGSNDWTNAGVTVVLSPADNLSGVAATTYTVDGGPTRTGTTFELTETGDYTITYSSTDRAGNAESPQTARVRIDKVAPTIAHRFTPDTYRNGAWTNAEVTVRFECGDEGGSGLADCSRPTTVSAETTRDGQVVTGTARDNAGNSASDNATVRVDMTAPTVTATADRAPNEAGWYDDDVTVRFEATDALSGVTGTSPAVTVGHGEDQSAEGSATDAAGNTGRATVTGINVDKNKPVLRGTAPSGWHTDDVTVRWECTDDLSGVATAPPATTAVSGEGANLSSTASCTDRAGNVTVETVEGITIDRHAPTTTASTAPEEPASRWFTGAVQVQLRGEDALSGVKSTHYRVDGGAPLAGTRLTLEADGEHTVTYWSEDEAGNVEEAGAPLVVRIDRTAPNTTVVNPISPAGGWFVTSGIPVAFEAEDAGSGVAATYYTIDGGPRQTYGERFTAELGEGTHTITYWSVDLAGNVEVKESTEYKTVVVKIDTEPPTVAPDDVRDTTWRNTALERTFTASDTGSGLASAADETFTLTAAKESTKDAAGAVVPTTVGRTVSDAAGNTTTRTLSALIDLTKPINAVTGVTAGSNYTLGSAPEAGCTTTDALSGPATQATPTPTGGPIGAVTVTCRGGTDKADNTAADASVTYTVTYDFRGFFQPIDNGGVYNKAKAGSTIPVKFSLAGDQGLSIFGGQPTATKVACSATAPSDLIEEVAPAGTTSGLKYDATAGQYIYNWKTATSMAGTCQRLTVKLADGKSYTALFNLTK